MGDDCLLALLLNSDKTSRDNAIASLFNTHSKATALRLRQNEKLQTDKELSTKQISTIKEIMELYLAPVTDPNCMCIQCNAWAMSGS